MSESLKLDPTVCVLCGRRRGRSVQLRLVRGDDGGELVPLHLHLRPGLVQLQLDVQHRVLCAVTGLVQLLDLQFVGSDLPFCRLQLSLQV